MTLARPHELPAMPGASAVARCSRPTSRCMCIVLYSLHSITRATHHLSTPRACRFGRLHCNLLLTPSLCLLARATPGATLLSPDH